ncbi:MAG: hypothetical protein OK457_01890 [Thaumarchaeota archaeon]|nr:hypothetical protein [Nitrososphaerota archaeon]
MGRKKFDGTIRPGVLATRPRKVFSNPEGAGVLLFGVYIQICFPKIEDVISLVPQSKQSFNVGRVEFEGSPKNLVAVESEYTLNVVLVSLGILSPYDLEPVDCSGRSTEAQIYEP